MPRIPSLILGEVYPPVTPRTFVLSGKTARSGYGSIGRIYVSPAVWPDVATYEKAELFTPLGNPPGWPPNTTGTFTLSTKVNRVTNNFLGRTARTWYVTVPGIPGFRADGETTCVWNVPSTVLGTFRADAAGTAQFEFEPFVGSFLVAQGTGGNTWFGFNPVDSGFEADGGTTCNFNAAATMLRMDGRSSASFAGESVPAPAGFQCQATGTARFMGAVGTGDECLTPPDTAGGCIPNFVF